MPGEPRRFAARPRLLQLLATLGAVVLAVAVWVLLDGDAPPAPPATSTTAPSTSTSTSVPSSTTTTPVPTTTTFPPAPVGPSFPPRTEFDVIVVGDGLGASTAATVAARLGADTLLLSPTGYLGGQAGAAGVSTMDEGGNRYVLRRSGVYGELVDYVNFKYGLGRTGQCYFFPDPICPEPNTVDEFFRVILGRAGVQIAPLSVVSEVIQDGQRVTGVVADGVEYQAQVVIDGTEFSDLYPMVEGLEYAVGSPEGCVQDTTWVAIRSWYPQGPPSTLVPAREAMAQIYEIYGDESDRWLDSFRSMVVSNSSRPEGSGPSIFPWDIATETAYRALADGRRDLELIPESPAITKTAVNFANDSSLSAAAVEDPVVREKELRRALHITYAYLWYLRWELGLTNWGVANDMGYSSAQRLFWDDLVPDELEVNLPPIPYVREGRRMVAVYNLGPADLADDVREFHRFDDAVMLGGYFTDFHGCPSSEDGSDYGLFEVPLGVFIPAEVDGFLPGIARAAGVSRVAAAAMRTQPEEIWGGEVAGTLAGLAAREGIQPREVSVDVVQDQLRRSGLVFFLPRAP